MAEQNYGPKTGGAVRYEAHSQAFADRIVAALEAGTAPWQKPWEPGHGHAHGGMPYNAATGKTYSGANAMGLFIEQEMRGYTDDRWLTFKQSQALGGNVRRGERGTQLVKWVETNRKDDEQDKSEGDDKERKARLVPVLFTVFNAQQVDGLAQAPVRELPTELERHEKCEALMAASGVLIEHNGGSQAYYRPMTDSVHLPARAQFHSADAYYATALHELGHATGHPTRMGRDLTGTFGSESYAREELRAEIASWMAGERLGIGHDPGHHGSYVAHWIKLLKDDPKEILRACADAEKICTRLGVEKYEYAPTLKAEQTREQSSVVNLPEPRRREERARQVQPVDQVRVAEGAAADWSPTSDGSQRLAEQLARETGARPVRQRERGLSMGR